MQTLCFKVSSRFSKTATGLQELKVLYRLARFRNQNQEALKRQLQRLRKLALETANLSHLARTGWIRNIPFLCVCALLSSLHFLPSLPHPICFAPSPSLMILPRDQRARGEREKGEEGLECSLCSILSLDMPQMASGNRQTSGRPLHLFIVIWAAFSFSPSGPLKQRLAFSTRIPSRVLHRHRIRCKQCYHQAMRPHSSCPVLALLLRTMHVPEDKSCQEKDN